MSTDGKPMSIIDRDIEFYSSLAEQARVEMRRAEVEREGHWRSREAAYVAVVVSLQTVKRLEHA